MESAKGERHFLLKTNGKWWMLPLIGLLLGFVPLRVLVSPEAAPFTYATF